VRSVVCDRLVLRNALFSALNRLPCSHTTNSTAGGISDELESNASVRPIALAGSALLEAED
jgi:hypothetical protein